MTQESKPVVWDFAGSGPKWCKCACGAVTARVPCWDCDRAQSEKADRARARTLCAASIPKQFQWADLNAPELPERIKLAEPLKRVAQRILGAPRVVFRGSSGLGKTSLACACLRRRVPHGYFVNAFRLSLARCQSRLGDGEPTEIERAMTVPVLLLDDVGQEPQVVTNAVRDVIFARHDAQLPTWITTGFDDDQLLDLYGDGTLRRMLENAYVVPFKTVAA